jgi:asparagine synthase (glutamine-hydrolysing)
MGTLALIAAKRSSTAGRVIALPKLETALATALHRHDGDATIVHRSGFAFGFGRTDSEQAWQSACAAFTSFSHWSADGALTPPPDAPVDAARLASGDLEPLRGLAGNFALLLVDEECHTAYLVRDPYALKPLYWAESNSLLMFASEIKVLLAAGFRRGLARFGLVEYVCHGMPLAGRTVNDGVRILPPGVVARIDLTDGTWSTTPLLSPQQHICAERYRHNQTLGETELIDAIEAHLQRSIVARLPERLPVGVFLSGGVDSSTITALARSKRSDIIGCVVDVAEPAGISEVANARVAANHLGVELATVRFDKRIFRQHLVRTIAHVEWPLILENTVALFVAAGEMADRGVRVMIDGEGADVLFGLLSGAVRWDLLRHALHAKHRWLGRAAEILILGGLERLERFGVRAEVPGHGRSLHLLLGGGYFDYEGSLTRVRRLLAHVPGGTGRELEVALVNEFFLELPLHVHRLMSTTMGQGVETRLPFLDPELVDLVLNLPIDWKVRVPKLGIKPVGKYILKRLAERHLPHDLLYRPKQGFDIPGDDYVGRLPEAWIENGALVTRLDYPADVVRDWYESPRTGRERFFFATCEIWAQLFWLGRDVDDVSAEYLDANH